jgi:hypothetical protein
MIFIGPKNIFNRNIYQFMLSQFGFNQFMFLALIIRINLNYYCFIISVI